MQEGLCDFQDSLALTHPHTVKTHSGPAKEVSEELQEPSLRSPWNFDTFYLSDFL